MFAEQAVDSWIRVHHACSVLCHVPFVMRGVNGPNGGPLQVRGRSHSNSWKGTMFDGDVAIDF
jgi:hypothetical protein